MMKVYVVFRYELPNQNGAVIDSIWRNFNIAYERMEKLKWGGYVEFHTLRKEK
jgi:hypothetical protein